MAFDFDPQLLNKYDTIGPRYTSYPTALQFSKSFDAQQYRWHIERSNNALIPKPLSIYIHIPFCHSLCYFCGCNKIVTQSQNSKTSLYLDNLFKEIELKSKLFSDDRLVKQIHFGGGTPNFFEAHQFREILETIANKFHLDLPSKLEISSEIDPRYIDAAGIRALSELGIKRFSLGVQDFTPDVQKSINRVQTPQQVLDVIHAALEVSADVSVDLITGLPLQTVDSFIDSAKVVTDAGVSRIAMYNFAYMPQKIKAQKLISKSDLPDITTRLNIVKAAHKHFINAGYIHIGMDHFALPSDPLAIAFNDGGLQRNFQGYTTHAGSDLIGIGVSAISQFQTAYAQNESTLSDYFASIELNGIPVTRGIALSQDDQIRSELIQDLMCSGSVNLLNLTRKYGINSQSYFSKELKALNQFSKDKLIKITKNGFSVTNSGRYFLRNIAMTFDVYLKSSSCSATQFSRTS